MPDNSDDTDNIKITDPLVPVYPDKTPIIWDDNPATLEGILYEVGQFYERTGLFQMFFKHHAVPLSNGKLAVDSIQAVQFLTGALNDPHDFDSPCPPTATRVTSFRASPAGSSFKSLTEIP